MDSMDTLLLTPADASELIAARARAARKRAGMTQAELAERADVSTATVARLEASGTAQLATFLRILAALGHLRDIDGLLAAPEARTMAELRRRS